MQADTEEIDCASESCSLFAQNGPSSHLQLSVIVPVRNEAHHLIDTLNALRLQRDSTGQLLNSDLYEVLMLANNCTDYSYEIAADYQQQHPDFPLRIAQIHLPPAKANIGTVRRILMDEAYQRLLSVGRMNGIIASTDGDTVVDSHWVYNIMLEIAKGNDAVGGRILTHSEPSQVRLYHLRDVMYRTLVAKAEALFDPCSHDPWPRHFQHFGASLAVTCQMYNQVGRLPKRPFLEDEAFYRALLRMDAKVRKSPSVKVFTSSRMEGRVAVGFSEQLRYWSAMNQTNQCQMAEPAEAVIIRLRNRRRLRQCWQMHPQDWVTLQQIAGDLRIDPHWLLHELERSRYFGELWEKIDEKMATGLWASHWQPVPITTAIRAIRTYLANAESIVFETDPIGTYPSADPAGDVAAAPRPLSPETVHGPDRP
ncbi:glycosyltransferase family 2 protein [Spirosoma sp. KNUC1025]|uniref:glycosyltransferase n=1 Tax=Spirosoma sp. KNUC1025 TaxID=2894082 RepID=UPI00386A28C8|nr:glycosyltransferase [Spirosoma sp. KNUC1025]